MYEWLFLLLVPVVMLLMWRRSRKRASSPQTATASGRASPHPFHAVSIQAGSPCCEAVTRLRGQRFLAAEAIGLPPQACDIAHCRCTYRHHEDRRSGDDRRHASIVMRDVYANDEQRVGRDRRRRQSFA